MILNPKPSGGTRTFWKSPFWISRGSRDHWDNRWAFKVKRSSTEMILGSLMKVWGLGFGDLVPNKGYLSGVLIIRIIVFWGR